VPTIALIETMRLEFMECFNRNCIGLNDFVQPHYICWVFSLAWAFKGQFIKFGWGDLQQHNTIFQQDPRSFRINLEEIAQWQQLNSKHTVCSTKIVPKRTMRRQPDFQYFVFWVSFQRFTADTTNMPRWPKKTQSVPAGSHFEVLS
jgi:hypothetical protein